MMSWVGESACMGDWRKARRLAKAGSERSRARETLGFILGEYFHEKRPREKPESKSREQDATILSEMRQILELVADSN
jgi:hypothetical protein